MKKHLKTAYQHLLAIVKQSVCLYNLKIDNRILTLFLIKGAAMVTSIILMKIQRTRINEVAEQLKEIKGISEVYSVSGNYDLIAIVRVPTTEDLALLVTNKMTDIEGIERTETMLAFKAYSKHDLEAMFAVGM